MKLSSAIFFLVLTTAVFALRYRTLLHGMPGQNDFIAFWNAFQAVTANANPYSPNDILEFQRIESPDLTTAQLFLSPPWLLVLMAPILALPLAISSTLWMVLNLILIVIFPRVLGSGNSQFKSQVGDPSFLPLLCFPLVVCLVLGQLSIAVALAAASVIKELRADNQFKASVWAMVLALKPHLVIVFGVYLLVQALCYRHFRFVGYLGLNFVALCLFSQLVFPGVFNNWLASGVSPNSHAVCSLIRFLLDWLLNLGSQEDILVVGGAASLCGLIFAISTAKERYDQFHFSAAMILSLVFAPYLHFYDFSLLLPTAWILFCYAIPTKKVFVGRSILLVNALAGVMLFVSPLLSRDFWYPLAFGLLQFHLVRHDSLIRESA